jgi:dephospho-CoA kinase
MLKIGITGGIGSGKTTITEIFKALGIAAFNSDERAKELYSTNAAVKESVIKLLGEQSYFDTLFPNFKYIGEQIFADKNLLKQVNALIHPLVAEQFQAWCELHQHAPYILKESALLYETGISQSLDAVIVVEAPEQLRIERVIKRSFQNREQVEARIKHQYGISDALQKANFRILNDGKTAVIPQVIFIHEELSKLSLPKK